MAFRLSISRWLDVLLPRSCLLCGSAADATVLTGLCIPCVHALPRLPLPCCPVCATPLTAPAPCCGTCLGTPPAYDATHAVLRYAAPLDRLVQQLKFGGGRSFHRLASADFLAAAMRSGPPPAGDLVMPVPLAPARLRERGFNQALEIARPLAQALRLPLDALSLTRVRDTLQQSRLPWRTRRANVRSAFACSRDLSGLRVIVIDDVMTTGATLDAVARALKEHGAAQVSNWVAARALRHAT